MFCRLLHWPLSRIRQPRVIAEVIGGILLGPSVMGRIPGFSDAIFPVASIPNLNLIANLGLVLFLFLVGLEVDMRYLISNWRPAVSVGLAGMALPFGLGCAIAWGLYQEFADEPGTVHIDFGVYLLFIGVAMAITVSKMKSAFFLNCTNTLSGFPSALSYSYRAQIALNTRRYHCLVSRSWQRCRRLDPARPLRRTCQRRKWPHSTLRPLDMRCIRLVPVLCSTPSFPVDTKARKCVDGRPFPGYHCPYSDDCPWIFLLYRSHRRARNFRCLHGRPHLSTRGWLRNQSHGEDLGSHHCVVLAALLRALWTEH